MDRGPGFDSPQLRRRSAAAARIVTLGIALFGVNLIAVYLASEISTGFELEDLDAAVSATFWLWLLNVIVHVMVAVRTRRRDEPNDGGPPQRASART